jgi:hypothetical protein
MRAKEFITENHITLPVAVARALPGTYIIPGLPNSDFYKQYRFGVALAGARGQMERLAQGNPNYKFEKETPWGENMIVSAYLDDDFAEFIDHAMKEVGVASSGKKRISTMTSDEAPDVDKKSPVRGFAGFKGK